MAGGDEGFLTRWSRLKRTGVMERRDGQGAAAPPPEAPASAPPPAASVPSAPPERAETEAPDAAPDLPDIASLTRESDFTPFLRAGVPEHLHRQALRALWKSDPIFSHHDGLTDYAEDFTKPDAVGDAVKTAWKIGRGFLEDDPEPAVAESQDEERPETSDDNDAPEESA